MDIKFTGLIMQWLKASPTDRDYTVVALYVLKLSGNQILYKNLVAHRETLEILTMRVHFIRHKSVHLRLRAGSTIYVKRRGNNRLTYIVEPALIFAMACANSTSNLTKKLTPTSAISLKALYISRN